MKFVDAIYASEKMIQRLMLVIIMLSIGSASLLGVVIYYSTKPAVIIERACETKVLHPASGGRTQEEIKAFIGEAISARFDSDRNKPSLLTEAQADIKAKELKELSSRKITQKIFVDDVALKDGGSFTAQLTRLIKVENIRTALGFSVEAKIFEVPRTEDNPYGLILSELKLLEPEVKK